MKTGRMFINGKWTLVDSKGQPFYSIGMNHVSMNGYADPSGHNLYKDSVNAKYGSEAAWAKAHVDRFRQLTLPQRGRMATVIAEHERILSAIEAHDAEAAATAMTKHIERLLGDIAGIKHLNPEFFDDGN